MISLSRLGALLLAGAGTFWGLDNAVGGYWLEAAKCGSVGVGFTLVAWSRTPRIDLLGLSIATVGTASWFFEALGAGAWPIRWGAVALGIALVAAGAWLRRAPAMRAGFAVVAFGLVMVLVREAAFDLWPASYVVAIAGALLLARWPMDGADARPKGETKEENEIELDASV